MTFEQFKTNVEAWQEVRGIYEHSTALAQALKAVSEVGELADAVIKGDRDGLRDAIGDVMVCLVGVAKMTGHRHSIELMNGGDTDRGSHFLAAMASYYVADVASEVALSNSPWLINDYIENAIASLDDLARENSLTILECCEAAWHEIKDRTGRMVAGGTFVKDGEE